MRRKYYTLICFLLVIVVICCIYRIIDLNNKKTVYDDNDITINKVSIRYPLFGSSVDTYIDKYIKEPKKKDVKTVDYIVNEENNKYTSILFREYTKDKNIYYYTLNFDKDNNLITINDLFDSNPELKDYISKKLSDNNENIDLINNNVSYYVDNNKINIYVNKDDLISIYSFKYKDIDDSFRLKMNKATTTTKKVITTSISSSTNFTVSTTTTTTVTTNQDSISVPITKKPITSNDVRKKIAFTFDDGPSKYTISILNELDKYMANATFFEVGYNIRNYKSVVLETYNRGFEIGNHTTDHSNLNKLKQDKIITKINDNNKLFEEITGSSMKLVRPPYGNCKESCQKVVNAPIIKWSVDSRDWESRNTEKIVELVMSEVQEGDIILFHSLYSTTLDAIKILLPYLYDEGYEVVSVSELFSSAGIPLENGKIYHNAR